MITEFKSTIISGGNILTPERIIISEHTVTWTKRNKYLFGVDSKTIPINSISSVEIDRKILGADITINSMGKGSIIAKSFSPSDARSIKTTLENKMRII